MDPACSELYDDGTYRLEGGERSSEDMVAYWSGLLDGFPIVSIEDGLAQDDWDGWAALTAELGARCQLVGDDIFVTNPGDSPAASASASPRPSSSSPTRSAP